MKLKNTFSHLYLYSAAAALAVSCGGDPKQESGTNVKNNNWKTENTVVYHALGDPDNLHPTNGNTSERAEIFLYTHVHLVQTNYPNPEVPCPQLANAPPTLSEDGLNYTYELRNDLKFDDGSAITAEDVIFSFKAVKCPLVKNPSFKPYAENLKEIVVDPANPQKITLMMSKKYNMNLWFVTDVHLIQRKMFDPENILSKYTFAQFNDPKFKPGKDLQKWAEWYNDPKFGQDVSMISGAGPYAVASWDKGQTLVLTKKKNHWSEGKTGLYEAAYPEKIIFRISREPSATMIEFKKQNFDVSTSLDPKTLLDLQEDKAFNENYESAFSPTYNYSYICMNTRPEKGHKKLFTDKKVRRAIAHLVPADDLNKVIYKGKSQRIIGPVSPAKDEYNKSLKLIEYDVAKAKKILEEAGWKDTDGDNIIDKMIDGEKVQFEFPLNYMATTKTWEDMAKLLVESFKKAGIKANMNPVQYKTHTEKAHSHDYDMFISSWGGVSMPEDFEQLWHTESWVSEGDNYAGFGNATTDALIDSIKYELDMNKRKPMVLRLQEYIYDEQPYVFLFASSRRVAIHRRFDNRQMYMERPGVLLNQLKLNTVNTPSAAQ